MNASVAILIPVPRVVVPVVFPILPILPQIIMLTRRPFMNSIQAFNFDSHTIQANVEIVATFTSAI